MNPYPKYCTFILCTHPDPTPYFAGYHRRGLNAFTTGNPLWGQIYLKFSIGRDFGAVKGVQCKASGRVGPGTRYIGKLHQY